MTESRGRLSLSRAIVVKEGTLGDRRATEAIHFARSPEALIVRYRYRLPQILENKTDHVRLCRENPASRPRSEQLGDSQAEG